MGRPITVTLAAGRANASEANPGTPSAGPTLTAAFVRASPRTDVRSATERVHGRGTPLAIEPIQGESVDGRTGSRVGRRPTAELNRR